MQDALPVIQPTVPAVKQKHKIHWNTEFK